MKIPTEEQEHLAFMEWAEYQQYLKGLVIHLANEGKRSKREGAMQKKKGMRKGIPDIFIPIPTDQYAGLWIELKRIRGFRISPDQTYWINKLNDLGYMACFAWGWEHATKIVEDYLK